MVDMSPDQVGPSNVLGPPSALRLLREGHEERVLAVLRSYGALSRADLGRHTGLSRATLSAIVRDLIARGSLVEARGEDQREPASEPRPSDPSTGRRRGRPVRLLTLNPAGGLAIGLDVGHRRIHAAIANVAHEIVAAASTSCAERTSWADRLAIAVDLVGELADRFELAMESLAAIGVGVVGPVPEAAGLAHRTHPHRVEKVRDGLEKRFDVPIHVDNNTRLAALAEAIWGAGAGVRNVLYARLSYGLGGGLVIDGHLYSGATGAAGELGHVCVDPAGPRCPCGGRGCLECYVSLRHILQQCRAAKLSDLLRRLESGDAEVVEVLRTAGTQVGGVLAAACNVVNPQAVVVGGELAAAGDALLAPIRRAVHTHTHRQVRQDMTIRTAELGEEGAARGGIALALRKSTLLAEYPAL